jgi:hypothetical protein
MMAGKSSGPGVFGSWPIWALVLLLGTYFINAGNLPFQSSRPPSSGGTHSLDENQDVDARLWQDPLGAIRKEIGPPPKPGTEACHDGPRCLASAGNQKTLVLGIMVPGSPFIESEELRRQFRYAVLSSLGSKQEYAPKDEDHIGYFQFEPHYPAGATVLSGCPMDPAASTNIAFEEFQPNTSASPSGGTPRISRLIVLWIDETEFLTVAKNCPLHGLSALQDQIRSAFEDRTRKAAKLSEAENAMEPPNVTVVFFGPSASTTLEIMTEEGKQNPLNGADARSVCDLTKNVTPTDAILRLYNFVATAEEPRILEAAECSLDKKTLADKSQSQRLLAKVFQNFGVTYFRTIANDGRLSQLLAAELDKRGIDFGCKSKDRILLVSEWDTFYGRTFPDSIKRAFEERQATKCQPPNSPAPVEHFRIVNYMRGLDGQLPEATAGNSNTTARGEDKSLSEQLVSSDDFLSLLFPSRKIERPEGNGQFDYLRRLGIALDRDARITGAGEFRAVGVVGNDVYDKLVVLQRLRSEFPKALFFTTDLDARLYHPSDADWTRGMIVASAYDLELRPDLTGKIPPFRNSYQTAAFLTTRLALEDSQRPVPKAWLPLNWVDKAGLFQLPYRRLSAYRLPADETVGGCSQPTNDPGIPGLRSEPAIAHDLPPLFPCLADPIKQMWKFLFGSVLLGLLFFCMALLFSRTFRHALIHKTRVDGATTILMMSTVGSTLILFPLVFLFLDAPMMPGGVTQRFILVGAASATGAATVWQSLAHYRARQTFTPILPVLFLFWIGGLFYCWCWPSIGSVLTSQGNGEPMLLFWGISLWPSLAIRALAIVLCLKFIGTAIRQLDENLWKIHERFHLDPPETKLDGLIAALKNIRRALRHRVENKGKAPQKVWDHLLDVFSYRLRGKSGVAAAKEEYPEHEVSDVWKHYCKQGSAPVRFCRIGTAVTAVIVLQLLLYAVFAEILPPDIGRGSLIHVLAWVVAIIEPVVLWLLVIYVADATFFCFRFVREIEQFRSKWPPETIIQNQGRFKLSQRYVSERLDIEFVGMRTACISRLIYFPFAVLSLLVVSRSPLFDNLPPDPVGLAMLSLGFLIVFACAIALSWAAETLRKTAVGRLSQGLVAAKADHKSDQIETLIHGIEEFREGAFTPLAQQHTVLASLFPLGGLTLMPILQYLFT